MNDLIAELRNIQMFAEMIGLVGLFMGVPFWLLVAIEMDRQNKRRS